MEKEVDAAPADPQPTGDERYRQLFENSPVGIINVALDGRPLMVNERAATTFGYASPQEFLDNVPSMPELWVDPKERDRAAEIMLETGVLRDFEVAMKRRDGADITLSVSANPWRAPDGTVVGLQVSGIDVTDRVQAVQRLEKVLAKQKLVEAKLTELNEMKTEFVSIVAHDLKMPLTVASGYADFLQGQWHEISESERRRLIEKIQQAMGRLDSLVAGVSEVTRLEARATAEDAGPFDLSELVRSTVEDVSSVQAQPSCRVSMPDGLPSAFGNQESVGRVLTNLLSNAFKYSPQTEPIDIYVGCRNGFLQVSVRDRGPGIARSDQSKLFQKFSRLPSNGDGPRPHGTGLGLFICKSLVESGGGSIWVESAPSEGSTFSFTLPIAN